jgi:hypothetical protein
MTFRALDIVRVHVLVPRHAPDHPANRDPGDATAVSRTFVLAAYAAEHVLPQLIPVSDDVTVPEPEPDFDTFKVNVGITSNRAVTFRAVVMETVHVLVPRHAPVQPTNRDPGEGVAVSLTVVLSAYVAEQVLPQLMPPTFVVTVPEPEPDFDTLRRYVGMTSNRAVTFRAVVMETVHVLVPRHAPVQPTNRDPGEGVALNVTRVEDV